MHKTKLRFHLKIKIYIIDKPNEEVKLVYIGN